MSLIVNEYGIMGTRFTPLLIHACTMIDFPLSFRSGCTRERERKREKEREREREREGVSIEWQPDLLPYYSD